MIKIFGDKVTIDKTNSSVGSSHGYLLENSSINSSESHYTVRLYLGESALSVMHDHEFLDSLRSIYNLGSEDKKKVARKVIGSLLKTRDFLGHQLSYSYGNMSDDDFENIAKQYLVEKDHYNSSELLSEVKILMEMTSEVFDSDQISVMFNCEIEEAEQALFEVSKSIR